MDKRYSLKLPDPGISVPIQNAGIVLINAYIPLLFERLGLTDNKYFVSAQAQENAVHYLQYIITGMERTEEQFLVLNKLLCGLPVEQPIKDGIVITEKDIELISSMIMAIINHWPIIGSTSVEGFRSNWLVRDGLLIDKTDKYELTVEKRTYDILINKSPFSLSLIRFPWMHKQLIVNWPY